MKNSSIHTDKNLEFKPALDSIVVCLNGNEIKRISKDIATRLAASKNPNTFGYQLERELGLLTHLMYWDNVFDQFLRTWEQIVPDRIQREEALLNQNSVLRKDGYDRDENISIFQKIRKIEEEQFKKKEDEEIIRDLQVKKRALEKKLRQERLRIMEEENNNLRQNETEHSPSPLEKALQSLQLRRQCEDKMFAEIVHTFGLPEGSLAIDPSRLDILRLSSVTSDQENPIDREYRKKFFLKLLHLFDNACANCKSRDNGVHLDHFMVPRSKGGTFIINTKTGIAIHNAIPLCEPCNIQKSNKDYRLFFSEDVLRKIFEILWQMPPVDDFDCDQ